MPKRTKDKRRERPAHATASPDTTDVSSAGVLWITLALVAVAGVVGILLKPAGTSPAAVAAASAESVPEMPPKAGLEPQVYQAIATAHQALVADPTSAAKWADLARVLDTHGLHEKAIRCYEQLRSIQPEVFDWAYLLAISKSLAGTPLDEVMQLFSVAESLNPNYAPLYMRMGDVHLAQKNFEAARDALVKAVRLDGTLAMAHRQLGAAYITLGDASNAIAILLRAKELAPNDALTLQALANAYDLAGESAKATETRESARQLRPSQALEDSVRFQVDKRNVSTKSIMRRATVALQNGEHENAAGSLAILEAARPTTPTSISRLRTSTTSWATTNERCNALKKPSKSATNFFPRGNSSLCITPRAARTRKRSSSSAASSITVRATAKR